ncbi:MAG: M1 family aminopeptidase [Acidobacteriota bacterium]|nr:M1 family aminopeptidase [Acidobacteriota bacterium]
MFNLLLLAFLNPISTMGTPPLTHAFAEQRAAMVKVNRYQLNLDLDRRGFSGRVTIHLTLKQAGKDLTVDFQGKEVTAVSLDDKGTIDDFRFGEGRITIPASVLTPGKHRLTISFKGRNGRDGSGLIRYVDDRDGRVYFFSDLQPFFTHQVFPCFDQPDMKAPIALQVKAPQGWLVVSNSPGKNTGQGIWQFTETPPLPTYLFHVSAGPMAVRRAKGSQDRYPMALYCRKSQEDLLQAEEIFDLTRKGLNFFEDWMGEPYPFAKYDYVFSPVVFHGGMENPGAVILSEDYLRKNMSPAGKERRNAVILHEMAHMWVGNKITPTWWNDIWLNEGPVNYLGRLSQQKLGVDKDDYFTGQRVERGRMIDSGESSHPLLTEAPDTHAAMMLFNSVIYGKGLAVQRQLAELLGPQDYQRVIRYLLKRHGWGNVDRRDFMIALETVTGRSFDPWRQQWLSTRGINTVNLIWEAKEGRIAGAAVIQQPDLDDNLRSHALELGLFYPQPNGSVSMTESIPLHLESSSRKLDLLRGRPEPAIMLVDPHDQAFVRTALDKRSLGNIRDVYPKIDDFQARLKIWKVLVDMAGDKPLPMARFIDLGLSFTEQEKDIRLMGDILDDMVLITINVMDEKHRRSHGGRLFEKAKRKVTTLPFSKERGLWFDVLLAVAETEEQLDWLYRLYSGMERCREKLVFSREDKWRFCARLVAQGNLMGAVLVKELTAEDTKCPLGKQYRKMIDVVTPTAAAKQKAWQTLTRDDLPLDELIVLAGGFHDPRRPDMTEAYVQPFFRELARIYKEHGTARAAAFNSRLFPRYGGKKAVRAARAFLKKHEEPALHYMVNRGLDRLKRREALIH